MSEYDVLSIGNAIVDIIATTDEATLKRLAIRKGAMTLVDAARSSAIYDALGPATQTSGGSAGNTAAGLVSLGGRGAYVGKVSADDFGRVFAHDIRAQGVSFETAPLAGDPPTARSVILVTPDGERSMNTYLGACALLGPDDIDEALVRSARVTYFEGYLWDPPLAKNAILKAAGFAHAAGRQVAMSLSDPFCVGRYRDEFLHLLRSGVVDIVFANQAEILSLYKTSDLGEALDRIGRDAGRFAVVTRSADGCVVVEGPVQTAVRAERIVNPVDTTGAGDLFAAGFLRGYTAGLEHRPSAEIGNAAAGHIIGQIGPRPQRALSELPAVKRILG